MVSFTSGQRIDQKGIEELCRGRDIVNREMACQQKELNKLRDEMEKKDRQLKGLYMKVVRMEASMEEDFEDAGVPAKRNKTRPRKNPVQETDNLLR